MKKLSKVLTLALTLVMIVTLLSACGDSGSKAGPAEYYFYRVDHVDAGYEGDVINTDYYSLVLNADGTYKLVWDAFVNQVSGVVVYFDANTFTGTYTVKSEADGIKTVELSAPKGALNNLNGALMTSAEDSSLLELFTGATYACDTEAGTMQPA